MLSSEAAPGWRNRQTRRSQKPFPFGGWGFDSPSRHQRRFFRGTSRVNLNTETGQNAGFSAFAGPWKPRLRQAEGRCQVGGKNRKTVGFFENRSGGLRRLGPDLAQPAGRQRSASGPSGDWALRGPCCGSRPTRGFDSRAGRATSADEHRTRAPGQGMADGPQGAGAKPANHRLVRTEDELLSAQWRGAKARKS